MIMGKNGWKILSGVLVIGFYTGMGSGQLMAQLVQIDASLDTHTIALGQQVTMNLTVEKPSGSFVEFPVFGDTLADAIEILHKSGLDSSTVRHDKVMVRQALTITSFDTGLLYIPPLVFVYRSGLFSDTIRTTANYLEVLSFPVDSTNTIRDIKDLYKAPVTLREIYPFLLMALGLALLVYVAIVYYTRRKHNQPVLVRAKPADPPDVTALNELEKLKAEKLWQQGKIKEYYTRLAEIIRAYIEGRYGVMALEQTSYEILLSVQEILGKEDNFRYLKDLLQLSDLAKFAKARPEPDENMNQLENAFRFVIDTRYRQPDDTVSTDPQPNREKVIDEV
jgi:hypothetical protein